MLRKITVWSMLSCVCLMFFVTGCSQPQARLQFAPGEEAAYKMVTETIIDYKFEQPSLKKLDEKRTGTKVEMTYLQEIENVEECVIPPPINIAFGFGPQFWDSSLTGFEEVEEGGN